MGTTATETLSVAGNIFVSQVGPAASCPQARQQPHQGGRVPWVPGALIQSAEEPCEPSPRVTKGGCTSGGARHLGHARKAAVYLASPTTPGLGCVHQLRDSQILQMESHFHPSYMRKLGLRSGNDLSRSHKIRQDLESRFSPGEGSFLSILFFLPLSEGMFSK